MDIIAIVISIFAFILSLIQFLKNNSRQKKEATLIAYNELQNEVFTNLNINFFCSPNSELYLLKSGDRGWEEITVYLSKLERFSTGINTGIYSIEILNRLGGGYYIWIFEKLMPIIS